MERGNEDDRFAANVRREREKRGWSQGEMASRLQGIGLDHFHPTTVSRVENGERTVRLSEASGFAKVLETTVNELTRPNFQEMQNLMDLILEAWSFLDDMEQAFDFYEESREAVRDEVETVRTWAKTAGLTEGEAAALDEALDLGANLARKPAIEILMKRAEDAQ